MPKSYIDLTKGGEVDVPKKKIAKKSKRSNNKIWKDCPLCVEVSEVWKETGDDPYDENEKCSHKDNRRFIRGVCLAFGDDDKNCECGIYDNNFGYPSIGDRSKLTKDDKCFECNHKAKDHILVEPLVLE